MTARLDSMTCCDFCPRAHTRECLTRHSTEARESARQHVAAHRARRSGVGGGVKRDSEMKREERASDDDAVMSEETSRAGRRAAVARARAGTEDRRRPTRSTTRPTASTNTRLSCRPSTRTSRRRRGDERGRVSSERRSCQRPRRTTELSWLEVRSAFLGRHPRSTSNLRPECRRPCQPHASGSALSSPLSRRGSSSV